MINFYYAYSIIWSLILVLYAMGYSDLCVPLDKGLLVFLFFSIVASFIIGYTQRKKFKLIKLTENPHKSKRITFIFIILYIISFVFLKKIPILHVLRGNSISTIVFDIPFSTIILSLSIIYSFYLSYLYFQFKEKSLLVENLIILFYFILLLQRQNILICILGFLAYMYSYYRSQKRKVIKFKKTRILAIVLLVLLSLYGFGVVGNMRFGSTWKWNDSSMIERLGRMNNKYPKFLPGEYFWSYIYIVTPLVNLNTNVINNVAPSTDIVRFSLEFVPDLVRSRIGYKKENVILPVESLTASTAYVRVYNYFGYFGLYIMFFAYMFVSLFILNITIKMNKNFLNVNMMSLLYILLFTFFTNTFVYSITSLILIFSFILSFKYRWGGNHE